MEMEATTKKIQGLLDRLEGFDLDWTQDFQDATGVYYTEGPDWRDAIPPSAEVARSKAQQYWEGAESASEAAGKCCEEARRLFRGGDLGGTQEALEKAAQHEKAWGDCPTYRPALQAFEKYLGTIQVATDALVQVERAFENGNEAMQGGDIWGWSGDPKVQTRHFTYNSAVEHCCHGLDQPMIDSAKGAAAVISGAALMERRDARAAYREMVLDYASRHFNADVLTAMKAVQEDQYPDATAYNAAWNSLSSMGIAWEVGLEEMRYLGSPEKQRKGALAAQIINCLYEPPSYAPTYFMGEGSEVIAVVEAAIAQQEREKRQEAVKAASGVRGVGRSCQP